MALKVKLLKIITGILFLCILTFNVYSENNQLVTFKTFSAEFERETIENDELLFTKGNIYFYLPYNVLIDVKEPVNQKMLIDSNLMLIYYPDENKAMKISSKETLSIPILSPFFSATDNDFGLTVIGYSIQDYKLNSDTLTSTWINNNIDKEKSLFFVIKSYDNKISEVIVFKTKSEQLMKRMIFSSYISINDGKNIPQELVVYDNEGNEKIVETITLKNIKTDIQLPDSIINFKIPDNTDVEEVQW